MVTFRTRPGIVHCLLRRKSLTFPDDVKFACRGHRPRQSNTESGNVLFLQKNYKINVDGVVVVWAAPETALSATALLEAALLEGEYPDLEEILNPQKPHKPENFLVVSPEKPSSSTTTNVPPSLATEINAQEVQKGTGRHDIVKRGLYENLS
ncbi:hypothetical protein NQ315_005758 [Exocentrus adspersus]|uniref:Uncharacterized protein n=1 Tax=Exocentrus adspersus TaxID=1586481 RepID=A0AAV8VBW2_9CUCU|nr:hypothetical protein NQ315_005758 [Exocentrus adspersus]